MVKPKNKYERSVLVGLYIIKYLTLLSVILNLALPIYEKSKGYQIPTQYLLVIFHIIGYMYASGRLEGQSLIIGRIGLLRVFQALFHTVIGFNKINWITFGGVVLLDIVIILFKFIDKKNNYYEYIEEDKPLSVKEEIKDDN